MNEKSNDEFIECDTCRAKPGSPELCSSCQHNRDVITKLNHEIRDAYIEATDTVIKVLDGLIAFLRMNIK